MPFASVVSCVALIVKVSSKTVRDSQSWLGATARLNLIVFTWGHLLQMPRIAAALIPAKMMKHRISWEWAHQDLVEETMSHFPCSYFSDSSVALFADIAVPRPADYVVVPVEHLLNACLQRNCLMLRHTY
jgi:hypothetical protein